MDKQRLDEIRKRLEAATQGPLIRGDEHPDAAKYPGLVFETEVFCTDPWSEIATFEHAGDAALFAHAPQDLRALLAEVARLQEALGQYADRANWVHRLNGDGSWFWRARGNPFDVAKQTLAQTNESSTPKAD